MADRIFNLGGKKIVIGGDFFKDIRAAQQAEQAGGVTVGKKKPKVSVPCSWTDCKKAGKWVPIIQFPVPESQEINITKGEKEFMVKEWVNRTCPYFTCAKHKKPLKAELISHGNEGYKKQKSSLKVKVTFMKVAELAEAPIMPLELPPESGANLN
ncbi:MAG: hypothetical protein V3W22_04835 [Thermoplasmata archaeon]